MTDRIAIVGNGVVGLALAYRLCQAANPPELLVFGPESPARSYAGSNAAPAMINVFGEVTPKLDRFWAARHQLDIGEAAMSLWPKLVADLNQDLRGSGHPELKLHRGTYMVARAHEPSDKKNLDAVRRALADRNRGFEEIDTARDSGDPIIRPRRFSEAIYVPDEMFVDATRLYAALYAALEARGNVTMRHALVEKIAAAPPALRDSEGKAHDVDQVVLANSFGFNDLVEQLGLAGRVPYLLPVFGVGLLLPPDADTPAVVRTPVYGSSCGDYVLHFPTHTYVGASAITNSDRVEITTHLQRALDFYDPDANLNNITLTGGIRAMSQDLHPVIGKLTDGVHAAAGFFKSGVTLAPYVADLLARDLLGEEQVYENRFAPFRQVDETPQPLDELVDTVWSEIRDSQSSSGSRSQLRRYAWLAKPIVRWQVGRTVRRFADGLYYNSDIVQAVAYDKDRQAALNRYAAAA